MADIDNELVANYDALRQSRGWSWQQMADSLPHDPSLAAHMRAQGDVKRDKAPKGRTASASQTTAAK